MIDRLTWLLIRDGKLLTVRSRGKNAWYLPGGKREAEESDIDALTREIREELDVALLQDSISLFGVFEGQAHGKEQGTVVRLLCYMADFIGELRPSAEVEELCWRTWADRDTAPPADCQIYDELHRKGLLR